MQLKINSIKATYLNISNKFIHSNKVLMEIDFCFEKSTELKNFAYATVKVHKTIIRDELLVSAVVEVCTDKGIYIFYY